MSDPRPERARLFVALDLPATVREALAAWRDAALAGDDAWRPTADAALHVTLCFLGWRAPADAGPVAGALERRVAPAAPLDLALGTAALLPPRRPRVLAVDLADPGGGLVALQAALAGDLAERELYVPERRPYRPHVTVARVRGRMRPARRDPPAAAGARVPGRGRDALPLAARA